MESLRKLARFCRERPYASALVLGSATVGAIAAALVPIEDLSLLRRIVGGALAGAFFALFPLGFRLFE